MLDASSAQCLDSSPAAYPQLGTAALEDLQYDMTTIVHQTLSHPSLHPKNLRILPGKKSWLLNLDLIVLADSGNIYDTLFMAAGAALWDTKIPRTRAVEYKARKCIAGSAGVSAAVGKLGGSGDMDVDEDTPSGFDTRQIHHATDFELPDYWDEGEVLDGRDMWPVCITLNLVPPVHFLDAILREEAAAPLKVLLIYSFPTSEKPRVQGIRMLGPSELTLEQIKDLVKEGEHYARDVYTALHTKLKDEDVRRNQKAREKFERR